MRKVCILTLLLFLSGCSLFSGSFSLGNFFAGSGNTVTVSKGDTLYSISKRYNVALRDMIEANRLSPPYNLYVGQVLNLPSAKFHVVEKGDTLYSISRKYGVDVTSLSRTNNIQPPYALSIGQRLALPGSVVSSQTSYASSTSETKTSTSSTVSASKPAAAPIKKYRVAKFAWPVKGPIISPFGTIAKGRNNDGINIKATLGTPVKAADKGTVAYAGDELKGFGNLVLIKHDDGWITAYAHNDKIVVKKGQRVIKGEKVATVGSSGGVNSPQLHFEVRSGSKPLNPMGYLE